MKQRLFATRPSLHHCYFLRSSRLGIRRTTKRRGSIEVLTLKFPISSMRFGVLLADFPTKEALETQPPWAVPSSLLAMLAQRFCVRCFHNSPHFLLIE